MSTALNLPLPAIELEARQQLARVPITQPPGVLGAAIGMVSRKMFGQTADNGFAMALNPRVLFAVLGFERKVAKFHDLDPTLKAMAQMKAAMEIGCSWCVDFGYFDAEGKGLDLDKLTHLNDAAWQGYDDLDRLVIGYAAAASATPPTVTDELVASLRADLGDRALVELTMIIAIENERSRFNAALGLVSQGFSASCRLPQAR